MFLKLLNAVFVWVAIFSVIVIKFGIVAETITGMNALPAAHKWYH